MQYKIYFSVSSKEEQIFDITLRYNDDGDVSVNVT
jgi:hypothetical protein